MLFAVLELDRSQFWVSHRSQDPFRKIGDLQLPLDPLTVAHDITIRQAIGSLYLSINKFLFSNRSQITLALPSRRTTSPLCLADFGD